MNLNQMAENFRHVYETHDKKAKRLVLVGSLGFIASVSAMIGTGIKIVEDAIRDNGQVTDDLLYLSAEAALGGFMGGTAAFCVATEIRIDRMFPSINHPETGQQG